MPEGELQTLLNFSPDRAWKHECQEMWIYPSIMMMIEGSRLGRKRDKRKKLEKPS